MLNMAAVQKTTPQNHPASTRSAKDTRPSLITPSLITNSSSKTQSESLTTSHSFGNGLKGAI